MSHERNVLSYAVLSFQPIICTFSRGLTVTFDLFKPSKERTEQDFRQSRIFILARAFFSCITCFQELKSFYDELNLRLKNLLPEGELRS